MASIIETVHTPWAIEDAFDFIADFQRIAEWDPSVLSCHQTSGAAAALGATYDVAVRFAGRTTTMRYEIVESSRPQHLVLHGLTAANKAVDDIQFESITSGTRITWRLTLSSRGPLRVFDSVVAPLIRRPLHTLGKKAMEGLAAALEGQRIARAG